MTVFRYPDFLRNGYSIVVFSFFLAHLVESIVFLDREDFFGEFARDN